VLKLINNYNKTPPNKTNVFSIAGTIPISAGSESVHSKLSKYKKQNHKQRESSYNINGQLI